MDFSGVRDQQKLARLTNLLGMGKPKYLVADGRGPERGPEYIPAGVVWPPVKTSDGGMGVPYTPTRGGEVIPLQSRQKGGNVSQPTPKDNETRMMDLFESIVKDIKLSGLESRVGLESKALGGLMVPPESIKIEQSKHDIEGEKIKILSKAMTGLVSLMKPQVQQKSPSGDKSSQTPKENSPPLESRAIGGSVSGSTIQSPFDILNEQKKKLELEIENLRASMSKPDSSTLPDRRRGERYPIKPYGERTSSYGSPGWFGTERDVSGGQPYSPFAKEKNTTPGFPKLPSTPAPAELPQPTTVPTPQSYAMQPEIKKDDLISAAGPYPTEVTPQMSDEYEEARRRIFGDRVPGDNLVDFPDRFIAPQVPPETPVSQLDELRKTMATSSGDDIKAEKGLQSTVFPESLEVASRDRWENPEYGKQVLANAQKISPNIVNPITNRESGVIGIRPGFETSYYEAHPEEAKSQAIYDLLRPPGESSYEAGVRRMKVMNLMDEMKDSGPHGRKGEEGRAARIAGLAALIKNEESPWRERQGLAEKAAAVPYEHPAKAEKTPAPHLVQNEKGEYVWATPGGVLPAGITGKTPQPKAPGAPHPRTEGGYTLVADPVTGLTTAISPTGQKESYDPKKHGEQALPGVITDEDAKMYANMMGSGEMVPSQLRLVVQPFGQAGGLSKNKIFKALKETYPNYNLKLAEAEYAADTKALTSLSNVYATAQTAMGAAENHGKQILELSKLANVGGIPAINRYWNVGRKQVAGDATVNNLDIAIHAYDREFARYLTSITSAGVLAQSEAKAMEGLISSAKTPEMLIGAVNTTQALMQGKRNSFNDQFNRIKTSLGGGVTPAGSIQKVWKQKPDKTWVQE